MGSGGKYFILEFNVLFGNQGLNFMGVSAKQAIFNYILRDFTPPFPTSPSQLIQIKSYHKTEKDA